MSILEREKINYNSEIIKKQWIKDFDDTQIEIKRMIQEEFYQGLTGILLNRIIAWGFNFFLAPEIREKAIIQFDIFLQASTELELKDEEILEKYFYKYMINDIGYIRCKRNHPKFSELRNMMKKSLLLRLKGTRRLLFSTGSNYDELFKNAYSNKEKALESTLEQLYNTKENLEFAHENKLMNISPLIKDSTMKILRKEIEFGKRYFKEKVKELYGK